MSGMQSVTQEIRTWNPGGTADPGDSDDIIGIQLKLINRVSIAVEDNAATTSRAESSRQNLFAKILEKAVPSLLRNLFTVNVFSQLS
jgi:hypothetical protein